MLHVSAAGWAATLALIGALLLLDLFALSGRERALSFREALRWSLIYVAIALLFGVVLGALAGSSIGVQYFTGYLVERSLSVDNLFVFLIIIGAFAVPAAQQPKAITIGIILALALRAGLIAVGAALLSLFAFTFLIFGLALIATAVQLFRHRDEDPDVSENPLVGAARRMLPITSGYEGGRLVARSDGRRALTPLFLATLAIGSADVLFAFDSVPAVFGVTHHAYIVFAANAFALLGLRPLFFLLSGLLDRLVFMSTGLAAILAFIGVKLVLEFAHTQDESIPQIGTAASLAVVIVLLAITVLASVIAARRDPSAHAHAGSLREHSAQPGSAAPEMRPTPDSPVAGESSGLESGQTPHAHDQR